MSGTDLRRKLSWGVALLVLCGAAAVGFSWYATTKTAQVALDPAHVANLQAGAAASLAAEPTGTSLIRVGVIGDSITIANSSGINEGAAGDLSWVSFLPADSMLFIGGSSKNGATTKALDENTSPMSGTDVLVIMAAVLDPLNGVDFAESANHLRSMVDTAHVDRVIISTIAPYDSRATDIAAYNRNLEALAAAEGWEFVDAMVGVRTGDVFSPGSASDGVHLTSTGASTVAAAVAAAITGTPTDQTTTASTVAP